MPFGADDVVGVVSLSLVCFHGCIKGLTVLSKAHHFDRDVSNIRLQIELEQHSLFTWAEAVGLTQQPPTLLISANDVGLVPEILGQLESLLSDVSQLKSRYGLDLNYISENVETLDDDDDSTLGKLGPRPRESIGRANVAIFHQRKSPWKKLRWVTLDEKKIEKLLADVKGYNARLEKFLEQPKRDIRGGDLDGVLRDAILNVDDRQKLDIIVRKSEQAFSKIAAVARLKQTRLKLGLSSPSPSAPALAVQSMPVRGTNGQRPNIRHLSDSQSSSSSSYSMRLLMRLLVMSRVARARSLRTLTYYDSRAVLLEWKSGEGLGLASLERRVDQVAAFLQKLGPSFHSLSCRGYVKDHDANRYDYIFNLPEDFQSPLLAMEPVQGQQPLPELRSLPELFARPVTFPSLNKRVSISVALLETLLNLHTAGWLHKEFRSDNIIFIRKADDVGNDDLDLSAYSMYIAGYVYARVDHPGEETEPIRSEFQADLYRHPLSLGTSRLPFHKSFDIFSVGCTLLEIGLWSSLRQILEEHSGWHIPIRSQIHGQHRRLQSSPGYSSRSTGSTLVECSYEEGKSDEIEVDEDIDPPDIMMLRHELLLSRLQDHQAPDSENNHCKTTRDPRSRCKILQSLEAAAGNRYTKIVEELLSPKVVSYTDKDMNADEH
ncbi:MAG: hypothetical protein Q9190_001101 [Brigantiaea leucoxantha]